MNGKTAKRLRHVCTSGGSLVESRYNTLKDNWKKVPAPSRRPLLKALYAAIGEEIPVARAQKKLSA